MNIEAYQAIIDFLPRVAGTWKLPMDSIPDIAARMAALANVKWFGGSDGKLFLDWEVENALAHLISTGEIKHLLLEPSTEDRSQPESGITGYMGSNLCEADFHKLSPEIKLNFANKAAMAKADAMKQAARFQQDRVTGANLPDGFDDWTPERKSSYADKLNAEHNKSKWERKAAERKARNS